MVNEKEVIDNIIYPFTTRHKTEYIKVHYTLNNELKVIIEKSGYKQSFLKKYQKSLRFLEGLKTNCTENSNLFEKLLKVDDLYSMRLIGERILGYYFHLCL